LPLLRNRFETELSTEKILVLLEDLEKSIFFLAGQPNDSRRAVGPPAPTHRRGGWLLLLQALTVADLIPLLEAAAGKRTMTNSWGKYLTYDRRSRQFYTYDRLDSC
jgi:hypothetical protein